MHQKDPGKKKIVMEVTEGGCPSCAAERNTNFSGYSVCVCVCCQLMTVI